MEWFFLYMCHVVLCFPAVWLAKCTVSHFALPPHFHKWMLLSWLASVTLGQSRQTYWSASVRCCEGGRVCSCTEGGRGVGSVRCGIFFLNASRFGFNTHLFGKWVLGLGQNGVIEWQRSRLGGLEGEVWPMIPLFFHSFRFCLSALCPQTLICTTCEVINLLSVVLAPVPAVIKPFLGLAPAVSQ